MARPVDRPSTLAGRDVPRRPGPVAVNFDGRHVATATVIGPNGMPQHVLADWYVSAVPCEKLAAVLTDDVIDADPGWRTSRSFAQNG